MQITLWNLGLTSKNSARSSPTIISGSSLLRLPTISKSLFLVLFQILIFHLLPTLRGLLSKSLTTLTYYRGYRPYLVLSILSHRESYLLFSLSYFCLFFITTMYEYIEIANIIAIIMFLYNSCRYRLPITNIMNRKFT